jgi:hypothetical protein
MKINIFYHALIVEGCQDMIDEQLSKLKAYCSTYDIYCFLFDSTDGKIKISEETMSGLRSVCKSVTLEPVNGYTTDECTTLSRMRHHALENDGYYLYMHTKGVTRVFHTDNERYSYKNIENWRRLMEYFCLEKSEVCLQELENHDVVGCNYIPKGAIPEIPAHYSGGFWWTKSEFLRKLPNISSNTNNRFLAEFWLGTINHKAVSLYPIPKPIVENHYRALSYTPEEEYRENIIREEFFNDAGSEIPDIRSFDKFGLYRWLREEAGVNHDSWFGTGLKVGGIELQQVPEEYVELLSFLKNFGAKKYLSVGIGKGGSFMVETYIQEGLEKAIAVDNSSYWNDDQRYGILGKIAWLERNAGCEVQFHDMDSVTFLSRCQEKFDAIFIDADHSYEGVKNDYVNALPLLNEGGIMIFHDINSSGCPGVVGLWNEIKNDKCVEFINSSTCGIGVYRKKIEDEYLINA